MGSVAGQTLYQIITLRKGSGQTPINNGLRPLWGKNYPMNVIKGHSCTFVGFVARKVSSGNREWLCSQARIVLNVLCLIRKVLGPFFISCSQLRSFNR